MKKEIIVDDQEPSVHCIWEKDKILYNFTADGWTPIGLVPSDVFVSEIESVGNTLSITYSDNTTSTLILNSNTVIPIPPVDAETINITATTSPVSVDINTSLDVKILCNTSNPPVKNLYLPDAGFGEDKNITFYVDPSSSGSVLIGKASDDTINQTYIAGDVFNVFYSNSLGEYTLTKIVETEIDNIDDIVVNYIQENEVVFSFTGGNVYIINRVYFPDYTPVVGDTVALVGMVALRQYNGIYQVISFDTNSIIFNKIIHNSTIKIIRELNNEFKLPYYSLYDGINTSTIIYTQYNYNNGLPIVLYATSDGDTPVKFIDKRGRGFSEIVANIFPITTHLDGIKIGDTDGYFACGRVCYSEQSGGDSIASIVSESIELNSWQYLLDNTNVVAFNPYDYNFYWKDVIAADNKVKITISHVNQFAGKEWA